MNRLSLLASLRRGRAVVLRPTAVVAAALVIAAASLVASRTAGAAPQPSVQKQVEGAIMCICPDDCGKVLINCSCSDSAAYRVKIQKMIAEGLDADQIIARFVAEKGKIVLAAPTTRGFDLTAWVLPFLALAVSVPIVVVVIRRLGSQSGRGGPGAAATNATTDGADSGDASLRERLERELRDLDT